MELLLKVLFKMVIEIVIEHVCKINNCPSKRTLSIQIQNLPSCSAPPKLNRFPMQSKNGRKNILTVYGSQTNNAAQWYVDLRSEPSFSELHDITVVHASELSRRKILEHDITNLNYDVIYFCANQDYDEATVGNALASYVDKGGILILTGPCNFTHLLTLKGGMEPLIPIRRGPQIHSQRTVDEVNTEDYAPIFRTLKSAMIHSLHIQGASMRCEDSRCFRIAMDENRGILAAVNLHGKGMILQLNVTATSFQRNAPGNHGGGLFGAPYPAYCANAKKLVLNAVQFALTTDVLKPKSGMKRKHMLISSDTNNIRFVRIKLADSMYVGTDHETALRCGEVIQAMVEGDTNAEEYYVKIPCTKCAQSLAYFLKTASLPASCIYPESFLSLLQAADYLQSDRLMDAIREYFMRVSNAEKVSKCDVDFNHEKLPFAVRRRN